MWMCQGELAGADGRRFLGISCGLGSNFGPAAPFHLGLTEFSPLRWGVVDARGSWLITTEYLPQSNHKWQ